MTIGYYGDHFVEKDQSFHVFYDVFCESRQAKNNRRENRDKISSINRANKSQKYRRNSRFVAELLTEIVIYR